MERKFICTTPSKFCGKPCMVVVDDNEDEIIAPSACVYGTSNSAVWEEVRGG